MFLACSAMDSRENASWQMVCRLRRASAGGEEMSTCERRLTLGQGNAGMRRAKGLVNNCQVWGAAFADPSVRSRSRS